MAESAWTETIPLIGPGAETVDLWRTFQSHGVADLPPMRVDEEGRAFEITLSVNGSRPRMVRVTAGDPGSPGWMFSDGPLAAAPGARSSDRSATFFAWTRTSPPSMPRLSRIPS